MFRGMLEKKVGQLSDAEFAAIAEIVTDDLKFNRINFKKSTSLEYTLDVAVISAMILKKCL